MEILIVYNISQSMEKDKAYHFLLGKGEETCRTRTWPRATFSRIKYISISMCLVR
jgi:hypothetical protein